MKRLSLIATFLLALLIIGCGGGGSSSPSTQSCDPAQSYDNAACINETLITQEDVDLPEGVLTTPSSGSVLRRFDVNNSTDFIEVVGTELSGQPTTPVTQIRGSIDSIAFTLVLENDIPVSLQLETYTVQIHPNEGVGFSVESNTNPMQSSALRAVLSDVNETLECSHSKSYYEESASEHATYIHVLLLGISGAMDWKIFAADEELGFLLTVMQIVLSNEQFAAVIDDYNTLLEHIENYDEACPSTASSSSSSSSSQNSTNTCAAEHAVVIDGKCFEYISTNTPTYNEIDETLGTPIITCPMNKPDEYLQECGYFNNNFTTLSWQASFLSDGDALTATREGMTYYFDDTGEILGFEEWGNNHLNGLYVRYSNSTIQMDENDELVYRIYEDSNIVTNGVYRIDGSWWYYHETYYTSNRSNYFVIYFNDQYTLDTIEEYRNATSYRSMSFFDDEMTYCYNHITNSSCLP